MITLTGIRLDEVLRTSTTEKISACMYYGDSLNKNCPPYEILIEKVEGNWDVPAYPLCVKADNRPCGSCFQHYKDAYMYAELKAGNAYSFTVTIVIKTLSNLSFSLFILFIILCIIYIVSYLTIFFVCLIYDSF